MGRTAQSTVLRLFKKCNEHGLAGSGFEKEKEDNLLLEKQKLLVPP